MTLLAFTEGVFSSTTTNWSVSDIESDHVVGSFRTLVELESLAVPSFNFVNKLKFFVVLETHTHSGCVLLNQRLIRRWIVPCNSFRSTFIYVFPVCVKISTGVTRRRSCVVSQAVSQQLRILWSMGDFKFHKLLDLGVRHVVWIIGQIFEFFSGLLWHLDLLLLSSLKNVLEQSKRKMHF